MAPRLVDRRAAFAACLLLVAALLLSVAAARFDTFPLDEPVARALNGVGDWYEPVADLTNAAPELLASAAAGAAAALAFARGRGEVALACALAVILRLPLQVLKPLVDRPRPSGLDARELVSTASFPSGHALTIAMGVGLWWVFASDIAPGRHRVAVRACAAAVVLLAGMARVWAGVHWPSDVLGSVLWAAAMLAILAAIRPALARAVAVLAAGPSRGAASGRGERPRG